MQFDFTDSLQTYVSDFYDTLKSFMKLTPDRPNMLKHRIWKSIRKMSYGILTICLYNCVPYKERHRNVLGLSIPVNAAKVYFLS